MTQNNFSIIKRGDDTRYKIHKYLFFLQLMYKYESLYL